MTRIGACTEMRVHVAHSAVEKRTKKEETGREWKWKWARRWRDERGRMTERERKRERGKDSRTWLLKTSLGLGKKQCYKL